MWINTTTHEWLLAVCLFGAQPDPRGSGRRPTRTTSGSGRRAGAASSGRLTQREDRWPRRGGHRRAARLRAWRVLRRPQRRAHWLVERSETIPAIGRLQDRLLTEGRPPEAPLASGAQVANQNLIAKTAPSPQRTIMRVMSSRQYFGATPPSGSPLPRRPAQKVAARAPVTISRTMIAAATRR